MSNTTARVDRQATGLLDVTFWSNVAVMLLLAAVSAVNTVRAGTEQGPLVRAAAPELVFAVSAALILYMGYGCFSAMATKRRLSRAFVSLDEAGVSGYALANPTAREAGEPFSLAYGELRFVGVVDVAITKKHAVPSLKIATQERGYIVPAPEGLREIVRLLAERMPGE